MHASSPPAPAQRLATSVVGQPPLGRARDAARAARRARVRRPAASSSASGCWCTSASSCCGSRSSPPSASSRSFSGVLLLRDHRGHDLLPRRLDDRDVAAAAARHPRRARVHRAGRAAQPLLPGGVRLRARDPAAVGGAGAAARRGQCPSRCRALRAPVLPFVLAARSRSCRCPREDESRQVFDFFYAVLVFQLGVVLVLGSIAFMRFTDDDYVESVALTVMGFGVALFVLAVLWNPMRGFGGLRTYFSRYLLSVGMPFELWMRRIAELAETEPDAAALPRAGAARDRGVAVDARRPLEIARRRGRLRRARASTPRASPITASSSCSTPRSSCRPRSSCTCGCSRRSWASSTRASGARARCAATPTCRRCTRPGARLTHDVKNLLQSLYALTSMAPKDAADGYGGLLQRQLPQLTKRLHGDAREAALAGGADARAAGAGARVVGRARAAPRRAATWRSRRRSRPTATSRRRSSTASSRTRSTTRAPRRAREPGIAITRALRVRRRPRRSSRCATPAARCPRRSPQRLFREPIERGARPGHRPLPRGAPGRSRRATALELAANRDGEVCFALAREPAAQAG